MSALQAEGPSDRERYRTLSRALAGLYEDLTGVQKQIESLERRLTELGRVVGAYGVVLENSQVDTPS